MHARLLRHGADTFYSESPNRKRIKLAVVVASWTALRKVSDSGDAHLAAPLPLVAPDCER